MKIGLCQTEDTALPTNKTYDLLNKSITSMTVYLMITF